MRERARAVRARVKFNKHTHARAHERSPLRNDRFDCRRIYMAAIWGRMGRIVHAIAFAIGVFVALLLRVPVASIGRGMTGIVHTVPVSTKRVHARESAND